MLILVALLLIIPIIIKIYVLFTHVNCRSKVCLEGKTALVTGGNSGIGYQIVLALVQRGCKVIICDKVNINLLENVYQETCSRNVVFKYVDLSSFNSVRELATSVLKDEEKLDILIHNAGIGAGQKEITEDGLDVIMQVNYFSAFLLTHLLADLMKKTKSRIVFTSSGTSYFHNFSLERFKEKDNDPNYYFYYPNSKLCVIIAAQLFAEKLKKYGVTSNTYHPGIVHTGIFNKALQFRDTINLQWFITKMLEFSAFLFGKNAEEGAQTAIHLACASDVKGITGKFFFETKPTFIPKLALNKEISHAVWEASERIVKLKPTEKL